MSSYRSPINDETAREYLLTMLHRLGVSEHETMAITLEKLMQALDAAGSNYGAPTQLIVDPNAFQVLKNITFNDKNLRK